MSELKGLATGIGSLPYQDAEQALDLIFKYLPNIPFWPQLPKRTFLERMITQFIENLPVIQLEKDSPLSGVAYPTEEKRLETFYREIISQNIEYFRISEDYAKGLHVFYRRLSNLDLEKMAIEFIKCQITGPFTFAASIKDESGVAYLHNPVFMQAILKGLAMKALWQIKLFKKFGKKIMMFIDEPYLGCFGSAYTPINREDVVKGLAELTEGIKSSDVLLRQGFGGLSPEALAKGDVLLGVHCCGNTDWSIFTDVPSIDIISFDAFGFLDKFVLYADNLKGFIKRGGIICWGIVPTQEFLGNESAELLVEKIKEGINILAKKGLDKNLLLDKLIISPSCGLGTLDTDKSEAILKLLSKTSVFIRKSL